MKRILATSAIAALIASGAVAQDQDQQQDEQMQQQAEQPADAAAAGPFVEATEEDLFLTQMIGIAVYAPEDGATDVSGQGGMIDSAEVAEFQQVGQLTDVMMSLDGDPRALVVALGMMDGTQDPAIAEGAPGVGREIAVDAGQVAFFRDETAPHLIFAVVNVGAAELQEAPLLERPQVATGGTGVVGAPADEPAAGGWMMGRAPMTAPGVAMDGLQQVPVAELSVDNLTDAAVYGADQQQIGSVNDVVLGAEGAVEYVTVDVGGFLGIGTHTVAIGFDEIAVLRDAGWDEVQVHISATQEQLEEMPEYEGQN